MPVLCAYQSDATSYLVTHSEFTQLGGKKVERKGKALVEYLLERLFLFTKVGSGKGVGWLGLSVPRPLDKGKTAWHEFTAACGTNSSLRLIGHEGIILNFVCFVRALAGALQERLHARLNLMYDPNKGLDCKGKASMLQKLDWFVWSGCGLHDVGNAYKHAVAPFKTSDLMDKFHIVTKSMRNGYRLIVRMLMTFVTNKVRYVPARADTDHVRMFWMALGIDADQLDHVVALDPHWDGVNLQINDAVQNGPDPLGLIYDTLMYIFKWRVVNDARFVGMAGVSRCMAASLECGVETRFVMTREDEGLTTDYHLHGVANLNAPMRKLIVICGITGYVSESCTLEMIEEPPLVRHMEVLENVVKDELAFLEGIDWLTWQRLSGIIGLDDYTPHELRNDVITAGHVQASFISRRVFQFLKCYPFCLAVGDIDANLEALSHSSDSTKLDPGMTQKVHHILARGYDRQQLTDGVALLNEVDMLTLGAEQGHGSMGSSIGSTLSLPRKIWHYALCSTRHGLYSANLS